MIRINLLPPELTKSKKGRAKAFKAPSSGTPLVVIILIIAYIAAIGFSYSIVSDYMNRKQEIEDLRSERDKIQEEVEEKSKEFEELLELHSLLSNQVEILKALDPPGRLLWSEKLNMLADIAPKGVYLTNVQVTEQIKEVQTEQSRKRRQTWLDNDKEGEEPPIIRKPVITQTLAISGVTWADNAEQRLQLIVRFHDAMKGYSRKGRGGNTRRFMDNFQDQIRIDPTYVDEVAGRTVNRFKLILRTIPFDLQTKTEEKEAE